MAHTLREHWPPRIRINARYAHSTVIVGNKLYLWGGFQNELPRVHDSQEKRRFTSVVDLLNLDSGYWERKPTRGSPPQGVYGYACAPHGANSIMFFGGCCGHDLCFHNDLTELSTETFTWQNVTESMEYCDSPMRKSYCGMMPVLDNEGWAGFFVVGGNGLKPINYQYGARYIPLSEGRVLTNEQHLYFNRWTSPRVIGDCPPPCTAFTFSHLSHNRGIMFGGLTEGPNNDVFIAEVMSAASVRQYGTSSCGTIQWERVSVHPSLSPVPRRAHGGVAIDQQMLFVVGGRDKNNDTISDCWTLDLATHHWKQIPVPESVSNRCYCSVSLLVKSRTSVWVVLFGGTRGKTGASAHYLKDVHIVELHLSVEGQWSVKSFPQFGELSTKVTPDIGPRTYNQQISLMPLQLDARDQTIANLKQELEQSKAMIDRLQQEVDQLGRERDAAIEDRKSLECEQRHEAAQIERNKRFERDRPHWLVSSDEIQLTDTKLGDGAYGTVSVGEFRGLRVAVKHLHKLIQMESTYYEQIFSREMEIASKLRHPNLLQFLGATMEKTPVIITELMPTSLYQVIRNNHLRRSQIISIGLDVSLALNYLHLWRPDPILHRDISSPNVLLDHAVSNTWKAKLGDFGSANLQSHARTNMPGNAYYAAPEARHPDDHSPAMDVYSFGVLLMEMTLCQPPEPGTIDRENQLQGIVWPPMKALVSDMLARERGERPHVSHVLKSLSAMDSTSPL